MEIYKDCLLIATVAWVYVIRLTDEGMILEWWERLLTRVLKKEWILKPVVSCEYCVAGQMALWFYPLKYFDCYHVVDHVVFICVTIFIVEIWNRILN